MSITIVMRCQVADENNGLVKTTLIHEGRPWDIKSQPQSIVMNLLREYDVLRPGVNYRCFIEEERSEQDNNA